MYNLYWDVAGAILKLCKLGGDLGYSLPPLSGAMEAKQYVHRVLLVALCAENKGYEIHPC